MTPRMVAAIANPHTDILGHCTGRLVTGGRGTRPESEFDAEIVFAACEAFGVAVEINSRPERLDPPKRLLRLAVEAGCLFSIDTDAHAPGQLDWQPNGCERAVACEVPVERDRQLVDGRPAAWTLDSVRPRRAAVTPLPHRPAAASRRGTASRPARTTTRRMSRSVRSSVWTSTSSRPGAGFDWHGHRGVRDRQPGAVGRAAARGRRTGGCWSSGRASCGPGGRDGVRHTETNASPTEPLRFLQLTLLGGDGARVGAVGRRRRSSSTARRCRCRQLRRHRPRRWCTTPSPATRCAWPPASTVP